MEFNEFVNHFEGVVEKSPGVVDCKCPICDEGKSKRRLHITKGTDKSGKECILINCNKYAGDGMHKEEILNAIHLTFKDLYSDDKEPVKSKSKTTKSKKDDLGKFIEDIKYSYYNVTDEGSVVLLRQKIRHQYENGKKVEWSEWKASEPEDKYLPLYNLQYLKDCGDGDKVYFTEGEKDCDNMMNLFNYMAVSTPHGARSVAVDWDSRWNKYLIGKDIVIITDNDESGRKHGDYITLNTIDIAKSVKVIPASALCSEPQNKDDISDVIQRLGSDIAKEKLRQAEERIPPINASDFRQRILGIQALDSVADEDLGTYNYLWYPYIFEDSINALVSLPGVGKSTLTAKIIANYTTGGRMLDSTFKKGSVLIVSEEPKGIWKKRLEGSGADMSKVYTLTVEELDINSPNMFIDDKILVILKSIRDIGFVVFDTYTTFSNANEKSKKEVRRELLEVKNIAQKYNVTTLFLMHSNKDIRVSQDIGTRYQGSTVIGALMRSMLYITKDWTADNNHTNLVLLGKKNYAEDVQSFRFKTTGVPTGELNADGKELTIGIATDIETSKLTDKDLYKHEKQVMNLNYQEPDDTSGYTSVYIKTIRRLAQYNLECYIPAEKFVRIGTELTGKVIPHTGKKFFDTIMSKSEHILKEFGILVMKEPISIRHLTYKWNNDEERTIETDGKTKCVIIKQTDKFQPAEEYEISDTGEVDWNDEIKIN